MPTAADTDVIMNIDWVVEDPIDPRRVKYITRVDPLWRPTASNAAYVRLLSVMTYTDNIQWEPYNVQVVFPDKAHADRATNNSYRDIWNDLHHFIVRGNPNLRNRNMLIHSIEEHVVHKTCDDVTTYNGPITFFGVMDLRRKVFFMATVKRIFRSLMCC